ncbi:hypothetical protein CPC08DRAFT_364059 [Agrocybe pediades]|nr:hypothetical protein CPC08DRAFT_364059 [Agrocybe pediades]
MATSLRRLLYPTSPALKPNWINHYLGQAEVHRYYSSQLGHNRSFFLKHGPAGYTTTDSDPTTVLPLVQEQVPLHGLTQHLCYPSCLSENYGTVPLPPPYLQAEMGCLDLVEEAAERGCCSCRFRFFCIIWAVVASGTGDF